tara:strand:- start:105 stop:1505 length:1401 start_codon:yes stop_codon:yes gene_type:complete
MLLLLHGITASLTHEADLDDAAPSLPMAERTALAGPPALPSSGCGQPLPYPVGIPSHVTLPLADPLLYNPYRDVYIYLPAGFDNTVPLPIVYSFHGFYSSALVKMNDDRFMWKNKILASKNLTGFIAVHPSGMADSGTQEGYSPSAPGNPESTWNVWGQSQSPGPRGHTCDQHRKRFGRYGCYTSCRARANTTLHSGCFQKMNENISGHDKCHASTCANDTLFMDTLFKKLDSTLCIDRRRNYATGMSVGGMMALWMAVRFNTRFAAAVPVAGSALIGFWQPPALPIAIMDIHGTEDATIPANQSNGFVALGNHSTGKPMVVPGCPECGFSDDGYYYTPNYNITRDIAEVNGLPCTRFGAQCVVKVYPTPYYGLEIGTRAKWTCFQSFGAPAAANVVSKNGGATEVLPVVRCTWKGKHFQPIHGDQGATTRFEKHRFFSNIFWDFVSRYAIQPGSEKEDRLLLELE